MDSIGTSALPHRVVRQVGSGGMGAVYEAWDTRLERRVALKVLHPHLTADPRHKDRLLREARMAARVDHDGIVHIYNIHEWEGGVALEMQFVEGTPLHRLIAMRPATPEQVADLLRQVLSALVACHARGVIHGDLKPGNLLVTPDGKVLIADFGIARAFHADATDPRLASSVSQPWGTPQYWPPEAWEGEEPALAWDLYALGVLAHEALTGTLPFAGHTPAALMREKLEHEPVPIRQVRSDISWELADLIDSLKANNPASRPASAAAALEQLRATPEFSREMPATEPLGQFLPPADPDAAPSLPLSPFTILTVPETGLREESRRQWLLGGFVWGTLVAVVVTGVFLVADRFTDAEPDPVAAVPPANQLADVPAMGQPGEILDLFTVEDAAYFSFDDGARGRELWRATYSGAVELIADINPGPGSSNPHRFLTEPGAGILFAASTREFGEEPWYCARGVAQHVFMIKDINRGLLSSDPVPVGVLDRNFLFYATDLIHGFELWATNSLERQTGMLEDLRPGSANSMPAAPKVCQGPGGLIFVTNDGRHWWLCHYSVVDGSLSKLALVHERIGEIVEMGGDVYVGMPDDQHGFELWAYRAVSNQLELVKDIYEGPESSYPQQFFVWKDALYFQATTKKNGKELWKSDGTALGTVELLNIANRDVDGDPYGFVPAGNFLFFRATELTHGRELWVTDGTPAGTRMVFDVNPGQPSGGPYNIVALGDKLFFSADDGAHGEELWALEIKDIARPPRLVADIVRGSESSEPHSLRPFASDEHKVQLTTPTGVFVYKASEGDNLMRIWLEGDEIRMEPYTGLPRIARTQEPSEP